jgi:hypothetical protein
MLPYYEIFRGSKIPRCKPHRAHPSERTRRVGAHCFGRVGEIEKRQEINL